MKSVASTALAYSCDVFPTLLDHLASAHALVLRTPMTWLIMKASPSSDRKLISNNPGKLHQHQSKGGKQVSYKLYYHSL